jgi:hypothetical protein
MLWVYPGTSRSGLDSANRLRLVSLTLILVPLGLLAILFSEPLGRLNAKAPGQRLWRQLSGPWLTSHSRATVVAAGILAIVLGIAAAQ